MANMVKVEEGEWLLNWKESVKVFLILEGCDVILTYVGLGMGYREMNPMSGIVGMGGLIVVKIIAVAWIARVMQRLAFKRWTEKMLVTLPAIIVAWNMLMIAGVTQW